MGVVYVPGAIQEKLEPMISHFGAVNFICRIGLGHIDS